MFQTPAMQERAAVKSPEERKRYQEERHGLFFLRLALDAGCLLLFALARWSPFGLAQDFRWSQHLRIFLEGISRGTIALNALYISVFCAAAFCLALPLSFYEGFLLEHRYGLSRQDARGWFYDELKKGAVAFVVVLVLLEMLYIFIGHSPRRWWLWAAGLWFFISVVLARLAPQLLLPLFFKSRPLEAGPLKERLDRFLEHCRIPGNKLYVLDFSRKTAKANALVAGLGATKKIFLSDTLLQDFPDEETEVVLAHEVGHYVHRDVLRLAVAGFLFSLATFFVSARTLEYLAPRFGYAALADIATLPLLVLVTSAVGLLLMPLQNAFSRHIEIGADAFALKMTGAASAFVALMRRLGEKNLSDAAPTPLVEFFFYDHPPIAKRIERAAHE